MRSIIQEFVTHKEIALLGASRTGGKTKFGNMAAAELKKRGYEVYLVHPQAETIDGMKACQNLLALKGIVNAVLICLPPEKSLEIVQEAAAAGMQYLWVQQGGESEELIQRCEIYGLKLVTSKCILMYANPVRGYHSIHKFIAQICGQY